MQIRTLLLLGFLFPAGPVMARPITTGGQPAVLAIRAAGAGSVRITLKPESYQPGFPVTPVLPDRKYPDPVLTLRGIDQPVKAEVAGLAIEVQGEPLRIVVRGTDGTMIQSLTLQDDGDVAFVLDDQPVLGMGEGGPATPKGVDWRKAPVQFDRRGHLDKMEPRWQREAYGSRNPVALLIGTRGWGLFFSTPWGQVDLTQAGSGRFIPIKTADPAKSRQTFKNQGQQLGKGVPPMESFVPGLLDVFVFDARKPEVFMKDLAAVSGPAVMPPKWSLGYMQSHRTLEDDKELIKEVDTFREKRIPIDAVIYLGTGFTPRGWNKQQPSFEYNPQVFKRDPAEVISDLHQRNVKVSLHMVPWDRDRLPTLQGSIPPEKGEKVDASHISDYWKQHETLVKTGVDAWWPDEGDWFDLFERMKRHQLYHEGPISTQPDRRPWSLHRNGHLGVARYGGWIWSGDTDSSWKTLETQIAVGINHSLSIGPYWGTDLGGFFSNPELTGELYARWFQFAAFNPSFRAHGRTWWTRLPWGWGLDKLGPVEDEKPPLLSELNNPAIEPIARRYAELRYQLLSYNYTLAWQARETGLPFMRALWLHHPADKKASGLGNEYLWGRDLLVAPVFEKGATAREIYLPEGSWYDWWTGEMQNGGRTITRQVDLATMPIYARTGAIIPVDPIRQFTAEKVNDPLTLRIYRGADGDYTLYEDDGQSQAYLNGDSVLTRFRWNDRESALTVERAPRKAGSRVTPTRLFKVELIPGGEVKKVECVDQSIQVDWPGPEQTTPSHD
ncbi:MAG: TIM-barrel domain-containing protein [Verrucomicrobiota bacterium]